jgi:hypothetical protein
MYFLTCCTTVSLPVLEANGAPGGAVWNTAAGVVREREASHGRVIAVWV